MAKSKYATGVASSKFEDPAQALGLDRPYPFHTTYCGVKNRAVHNPASAREYVPAAVSLVSQGSRRADKKPKRSLKHKVRAVDPENDEQLARLLSECGLGGDDSHFREALDETDLI